MCLVHTFTVFRPPCSVCFPAVSSQPNPCPIGYRPFSCTVCIMITEDELPFSQSLCPSSRISFQLDNVQNRTLQRYLEVYNNTLLWTDYEIKNGKAILPNSTTTVGLPIIGAKTCSNCCLALQLDPYGLMVSDCERALPAVCFTSVNCECTLRLCVFIFMCGWTRARAHHFLACEMLF